MTLITRLSRLFHADVNAVIDQLEEPELLLKQAIREMEETLNNDERQLKLLNLEQQQHQKKQQELAENLTQLEQQIALCFKSDKTDLAKKLIRRKLETEQFQSAIMVIADKTEDTIKHLHTQLQEQQSQLSSMKQKADIFSQTTTDTSASTTYNDHAAVQDEDVEVAFLHEQQKWSAS
ncbi:hypothetical protein A9Q78_02765 [Methylophaga sp. 41_12_T18]|nr:hypothetical protein A9Q78_02765 [Methylophaga sp. 41_12_T18]